MAQRSLNKQLPHQHQHDHHHHHQQQQQQQDGSGGDWLSLYNKMNNGKVNYYAPIYVDENANMDSTALGATFTRPTAHQNANEFDIPIQAAAAPTATTTASATRSLAETNSLAPPEAVAFGVQQDGMGDIQLISPTQAQVEQAKAQLKRKVGLALNMAADDKKTPKRRRRRLHKQMTGSGKKKKKGGQKRRAKRPVAKRGRVKKRKQQKGGARQRRNNNKKSATKKKR